MYTSYRTMQKQSPINIVMGTPRQDNQFHVQRGGSSPISGVGAQRAGLLQIASGPRWRLRDVVDGLHVIAALPGCLWAILKAFDSCAASLTHPPTGEPACSGWMRWRASTSVSRDCRAAGDSLSQTAINAPSCSLSHAVAHGKGVVEGARWAEPFESPRISERI